MTPCAAEPSTTGPVLAGATDQASSLHVYLHNIQGTVAKSKWTDEQTPTLTGMFWKDRTQDETEPRSAPMPGPQQPCRDQSSPYRREKFPNLSGQLHNLKNLSTATGIRFFACLSKRTVKTKIRNVILKKKKGRNISLCPTIVLVISSSIP